VIVEQLKITSFLETGCFHFFVESDFSFALSWPRSMSQTTRCPTTAKRNSARWREASAKVSSSAV
jgi:hypothetical protein